LAGEGGQGGGAGGRTEFATTGEALAYLHSLFRPGVRAMPTLDRMRELLRRLGHPETGLRTVHITGTNGKGSVAASVAAIFRAAGYRTGLFISPYLERYGERIVLDGQELPDWALLELVPAVREAIAAMVDAGWEQPTEFEATTALATLYYARERAEVISLEAGLGGRTDATNAILGSLVSVITRVGFDHMDRLGPTLADIAREKSGIIRHGGAVVAGTLPPEALEAVSEAARANSASLYLLGRDFGYQLHRSDREGLELSVYGRMHTHERLRFPLLGAHQAPNVACAVAAVECAAERGLFVTPGSVRAGLAGVVWPGRLEVLGRNPLVVLDGAHNQDAITALAEAIPALFGRPRIIAVLGVLGDKAQEALFSGLMPLVSETVITTPDFAPRAMPARELAAMIAAAFPATPVRTVPAIPEALSFALGRAGPDDMVLVTGSFYLVGAARGQLRKLLG